MKDVRIGTWCEIPTPYVPHVLVKAGLDFVILDMEHGPIDFELAQNMVFAVHGEQGKVFVRVPEISETYVLRALDIGADGIVFPQVSSDSDVEKIIEYSKFAPLGKRGFNPYITAGGYKNVDKQFFQQQNDRIELAVILEGRNAFENIESLLNNEHIDIVYIGQYDLSIALGVSGDVCHPLVLDTMSIAVKKINLYGKQAGCMVHNIKEAKQVIDQGFRFVVYKVDAGVLFQSFYDFSKEVKPV